jgi:hypothetical protein
MAKPSRLNNSIRPGLAVGQFGNSSTGSGVRVHLDVSHDQITNREGDMGVAVINALTMGGTVVLGQQVEDTFGKLGSGGSSEAKESVNISSLGGGRSRGGEE